MQDLSYKHDENIKSILKEIEINIETLMKELAETTILTLGYNAPTRSRAKRL